MNKNTIQGQWSQVKGKVKERWGDLTNNDLSSIDGKRDQLVGRIQERYGLAQEEAERQVSSFETNMGQAASNDSQRRVA